MGELWETRVHSVASQHAALSLSSRCPSLSLSPFLFWQTITGGFMQIAYWGLEWAGKTCSVNTMCTSEPGSTPRRVMVRVCLCVCVYIPLSLCVVMAVFVLPPRSRWHGPSPSWSPGCPGWRIPVGQGESLPQNGWSYASQSLHLKHTR